MIITIPVKPVAAPRQTQSDKWRTRDPVADYRLYRDQVRYHWRKTGASFPDAGASIYFYLPWSESWPQAKKDEMIAQYHHQKPDTDNLLKGFIDGLFRSNSKSKIKIPQHNDRDDASIAHYGELAKYWAKPEDARIEVHLPGDGVYANARRLLKRTLDEVYRVTPEKNNYHSLFAEFNRLIIEVQGLLKHMERDMEGSL